MYLSTEIENEKMCRWEVNVKQVSSRSQKNLETTDYTNGDQCTMNKSWTLDRPGLTVHDNHILYVPWVF